MNEIEVLRQSALVDPTLHVWGWEIPIYLFLGGLTAGIMILSARLGHGEPRSRALRWMPFAAPLLLSLGMGALFLDLGSKLHVFRFYTTFRVTSPMSWGAWILVLVYPATMLLGLSRLTEGEHAALVRSRAATALRAAPLLARIRRFALGSAQPLEIANVLLGIALGTYTGILLGTLGARALWSSVLLGPLFLASGLSAAAAFVALFPLRSEEHASVLRWGWLGMSLEAAALGLFFVDLASSGGSDGRAAAALLLGGPYTAAFFALVVIAGMGVPLFLEVHAWRRHLAPAALAPALSLLGGLALRFIIVAAGQAT